MNYTKKTLKRYFQYCLRQKGYFILIIFSVILASALNAILPLYSKMFFDVLSSGKEKDVIFPSLINILWMFAALFLVQWVFWRVATFSHTRFQSSIMSEIGNDCFAYLHKHSFSFFQNNFVGSLVKKVRYFVRAFEDITDKVFWSFIPLIVNLGIIIYVLFNRNYLLGAGLVAWLLVFFFVNFLFVRYKLKYDIKKAEMETKSTGVLADTITNSHTIQLFNGYKPELEEFSNVSEDLRKIRKFTWDLGNWFEAGQGFLMILLELGIFFMGAYLWKQGLLTIGDFVLIQIYLFEIFGRVWDFAKMIRHIYEHLSDAEEMTEILETPHEVVDIIGAKEITVKEGRIEFKDVDFYYNQTRPVLRNFNLDIKGRERVALIGPSGAGKTTIVRLILRIYNLTKGKILIDGQDITRVQQDSLRRHISLVPQDPILFHRTLLDNIKYGSPNASNEEVIEASKKAHCHEFINLLDSGYETYVGERGIKLSGGERQRVAIARAILRNTPILVLDEATSSLDSESEKLIQEAIKELIKDKTVIVIAHRLSTIRQMDRIIVIDDGKIVEEGSHAELLNKDLGHYKKLWEIQAEGFLPNNN